MTATHYPFLFATLGEAANVLPEAVARALETTLSATHGNTVPASTSLLACLQRIRQVDAADGQPGQRRAAHPDSAWPWPAPTAPMPA